MSLQRHILVYTKFSIVKLRKEDIVEIGDKIRDLRHKMGLTQEELAEKIGRAHV